MFIAANPSNCCCCNFRLFIRGNYFSKKCSNHIEATLKNNFDRLIRQADLGSDFGGGVCCYIQLLILSDIGQVVFDAVMDLELIEKLTIY